MLITTTCTRVPKIEKLGTLKQFIYLSMLGQFEIRMKSTAYIRYISVSPKLKHYGVAVEEGCNRERGYLFRLTEKVFKLSGTKSLSI